MTQAPQRADHAVGSGSAAEETHAPSAILRIHPSDLMAITTLSSLKPFQSNPLRLLNASKRIQHIIIRLQSKWWVQTQALASTV